MGIVFGVTGTKEPPFQLVKSGVTYEVRKYGDIFAAEINMTNKDSNAAFRALARYIGAFGEPENSCPTKVGAARPIAMTAPVITAPACRAIAMSAPVMSNFSNERIVMQFVLPDEFKAKSDIPTPLNPQIQLLTIPGRVVAVKKFSGWYSDEVGKSYFEELKISLENDDIIDKGSEPEWSVAQYHPPFTLPFLRRNEIWIDIDESRLLNTETIHTT
jgi:hypothetical protein